MRRIAILCDAYTATLPDAFPSSRHMIVYPFLADAARGTERYSEHPRSICDTRETVLSRNFVLSRYHRYARSIGSFTRRVSAMDSTLQFENRQSDD
jgi:hypothetical protein